MRHAIKPLLGALLALVALAALTSTPASAATCKKGTSEAEHKTLCVEGKQVGSPTETVTTTATFTQSAGASAVVSNSSQGWSVACATVETTKAPVIKSGGTGNVNVESLGLFFSGCKVLQGEKEQPACHIEDVATQLLAGSLGLPENVGLTGKAESFGSFEISGCTLSALYTINGTQGCSLKQSEVESVAKELVCEPKNSKLKFSGGFGTATLKLEGNLALAGASKGKKYSITK